MIRCRGGSTPVGILQPASIVLASSSSLPSSSLRKWLTTSSLHTARGQPDINRTLTAHRTLIPANWSPRATRAPAAPEEHSQQKFTHVTAPERHTLQLCAHVATLCAGLRAAHQYHVHALLHTRCTTVELPMGYATPPCKITDAAAARMRVHTPCMQTTSSACKLPWHGNSLTGTSLYTLLFSFAASVPIPQQNILAPIHPQTYTTIHGMTRRTQNNSRRQRQSCRACRGLHSGRRHVIFMPRAARAGAAVRAGHRGRGVGGRTHRGRLL